MKWDVIFIIIIVIISAGLLIFNYWWLPKQETKNVNEVSAPSEITTDKNQTTAEQKITEEKTKNGTANWCPVGTSANFGGSDMYEVKGIENHTIMGKSMDLCCGERTATSGLGKGKKCIDTITGDYNYLIMWVASEQTGWQYDKLTEIYPKDGQRCSIQFENNKDIGTVCLPK